MSLTVRTRALVLRRIPYSDSSQVVWAFSRDEGVVHLLAKGALRAARRSSRFPSPFDLAGWYDVVYRHGRGGMHLAMEGRLVEGFDHLRRRLDVWLDAVFAIEVMLRMFQPGDPHPDFLRSALSYLKLLGVDRGRRPLRLHYLAQLLEENGFRPRWERCAECGADPGESDVAVRIPMGTLCPACARPGDERVRIEIVRYLAAEAETPWGRVPFLAPRDAVLAGSWRLLRGALLYHLERAPRSLRYLR